MRLSASRRQLLLHVLFDSQSQEHSSDTALSFTPEESSLAAQTLPPGWGTRSDWRPGC